MIYRFAFVLLLLFPSAAQALSCMRPDIGRSYDWYDEAEGTYGVFVGRFRALETAPQARTDRPWPNGEYSVDFEFSGSQILRNGQRQTATQTLQVRSTCAGPWCASFNLGTDPLIAFIELGNSGGLRVLELGACGGSTFQDTRTNRQILQRCFSGQSCAETF